MNENAAYAGRKIRRMKITSGRRRRPKEEEGKEGELVVIQSARSEESRTSKESGSAASAKSCQLEKRGSNDTNLLQWGSWSQVVY